MKTVKEISDATGISVRTLHYYDEIGLLKPTEKSDAGYRLYDERALETLQQILFFREFDLPLKEIGAILDDPSRERNEVLRMQRRMLEAKKERLEKLMANIDVLLEGEERMDFTVFQRSEMEELCQYTFDHLPEKARQAAIREFGSEEKWKEHYLERASQERMQRGYQKLVEWYGSREAVMDIALHPPEKGLVQAMRKRQDAVLEKLNGRRACPMDSFEVRECIGEYEFVMKRLCQMDSEEGTRQMMLSLASSFRREEIRQPLDAQYGEGAAAFFAGAIEAFYHRA